MNPRPAIAQCGVCGSTGLIPLFEARDRNFRTTDQVFVVHRCPACGIAQTLPMPSQDQLAGFYPPAYYPTGGMKPDYYRRRILPAQQEKLDLLLRFRSSGRLLDAGCGAGFFVRAAADGGFQAEGLEMSADAVAFGIRENGVRITHGNLLEAHFPHGSFDVVTLWHVLEHLPRPVETLRRVRMLLSEGGILVTAVPNFASLQARVFRSRWYHLEVPRHLYHFTPNALRRLLEAEHFHVVGDSCTSGEHNWAGIMGSIAPLSAPEGNMVGRLIRIVAGRPLARGAAALESALGRGGTFALVSRKAATPQ